MKVVVTAQVKATEDAEKVARAVLNIFPDARIDRREGEIFASAASLDRFAELLEEQRIRDSARAKLLHSRKGGDMVFSLNKQAAFAGKVSFGERSPLGDIEVRVEAEDPEGLVDMVAPSTKRRPV